MARKYNHKTVLDLEYEAGKKRLRTEANVALAAMLNDALDAYTRNFNTAVAGGTMPRVTFTPEEVRKLLFKAAKRELSPPVPVEGREVADADG